METTVEQLITQSDIFGLLLQIAFVWLLIGVVCFGILRHFLEENRWSIVFSWPGTLIVEFYLSFIMTPWGGKNTRGETLFHSVPRTGLAGVSQGASCVKGSPEGEILFHAAPRAGMSIMASMKAIDDTAVDAFSQAMKAKLDVARAKGRAGWNNSLACSDEQLADMLIQHLAKGNDGTFEDVANFAMMLHQRKADPVVLKERFLNQTCSK